jgi:hypothetical protein
MRPTFPSWMRSSSRTVPRRCEREVVADELLLGLHVALPGAERERVLLLAAQGRIVPDRLQVGRELLELLAASLRGRCPHEPRLSSLSSVNSTCVRVPLQVT